MNRFPLLLADIGATVTRIAIMPSPSDAPVVIGRVATADHGEFESAAELLLRQYAQARPVAAMLAVAGRLSGGVIRLTNAAWTVDPAAVGRRLRLGHVTVVNDYVPVAALLPHLRADRADEVVRIGPSKLVSAGAARIVVGLGTGVGVAALLPGATRSRVHPTEAGHVSYGACEEPEFALWPHLERAHGRITAESVLAAPGLLRLHRARAASRALACAASVPADVTAAASAGEPDAIRTLELYAGLLGRYSGDLALTFSALGGVYLGGGLAPRLLAALQGGQFRDAFESKEPFASMLRGIPTYVIAVADPALRGLAILARDPRAVSVPAAAWSADGAASDREGD